MSLIEDEKNISKCIDLAKQALDQGEAPFASIITKNGQIISEAINGAKSKVSDHAEILALHKAHKSLKTPNLSACTLYSICEPCPMCSFMIREYKISKVVFALASPFLGGYTKWSILQDEEMTQFEKYFSPPPTIVAGILENEAKKVFDQTPLWMFGSKIKK
ncbi:nucleoside deaminase [Patescibacteria group bacterium]|nr:nucleoside deaminase [Patescibacteria group bacterium]